MLAGEICRSALLRACRRLLLLLIGWVVLVPAIPAFATLSLTDAERKWLTEHPVIRSGGDLAYAPYASFDNEGKLSGIAADFAARIATDLGVKFEAVPNLTWPQILEVARNRNLDLITTAAYRPDREAYLAFTEIYLPTPQVMLTRSEAPRITTPRALSGRRVALVQGYSTTEEVREHVPGIIARLVATPLDGLTAVATGDADAYIGVLGVCTHLAAMNGLSNLKVNAGFDMDNGQRFGVRNDWPELVSILEKAVAAIPAPERASFFNRWIPVPITDIPLATTQLTTEEKDFASEHPTVRVGVEADNAAFTRATKGADPEGIATDFLQLATSKTGLSLDWNVFDSGEELDAALRDGRIDAIAAYVPSSRLSGKLLTTEPYFASPIVLLQRADRHELITWSNIASHTVALRESGFSDHLLSFPPGTTIKKYATYPETLEAVNQRVADVAIGNLLTNSALIASRELGDFRVSERVSGADFEITVAFRQDAPVLRNTLDKGLASISEAERAEILHRWLTSTAPQGLDRNLVLAWFAMALGIAATGFAIFTYYNRKLTKTVAQRTKALSDSEERFRVIFEQAAIGIAIIAPDGRWTLVNDKLCEIVDYPREELLTLTFQEITHPDDLHADMEAVRSLLEGRSDTYFSQKRYIRKDQRPVWVDLTVAVVRPGHDEPDYFIVIAQDIDARKQAEAQVIGLTECLEHRVEERTQQLAAANRELESFSYTVSHDLKAPLRGIEGYSALLQESIASRADAEELQFLKNIRLGAKQMNTLIEDLLAYSRIERRTITLLPISLRPIVQDAVREFQQSIDKRGITLTVDVPERVVRADRAGLLLALRNLIGNAIKFSAPVEKPEIWIGTEVNESIVTLIVRDNGIGFDPQFHERIFEIFQRLNRAEDYEGTGIGLAIARKAVQRMGGTIRADSVAGAGASFYIELPPDAASAFADAITEQLKWSGVTIAEADQTYELK